MKFGIVVFPGSNCDHDAYHAVRHVLGQDGFEAALAQHVLWGYMLVVVALCGAGRLSLDHLLEKRAGTDALR